MTQWWGFFKTGPRVRDRREDIVRVHREVSKVVSDLRQELDKLDSKLSEYEQRLEGGSDGADTP